jgi:hypothetical protein
MNRKALDMQQQQILNRIIKFCTQFFGSWRLLQKHGSQDRELSDTESQNMICL